MSRIQRHVGASGLENAQHGQHQLRRTLQADADAHFGPDALPLQVAGQLIRPLVQLAVGPALPVQHDGGRVGLPGGMRLEQVLHEAASVVVCRRVVPLDEDRAPAFLVQQRQRGDLLIRRTDRGSDQHLVLLHHAIDGFRAEQVGAEVQAALESVGPVEQFQRQVEVRRRRGGAVVQERDLQPDVGRLRQLNVLQRKHHLEQRVAAQVAGRLDGVDDLIQRHLLTLEGVQGDLPDAIHGLAETGIVGQVGPQHDHVHEVADQGFRLRPVAVGDRHPDGKVVLAAVAVEQDLKGGQQDHERRHALAAAEFPHRLRWSPATADTDELTRAWFGSEGRGKSVGSSSGGTPPSCSRQ